MLLTSRYKVRDKTDMSRTQLWEGSFTWSPGHGVTSEQVARLLELRTDIEKMNRPTVYRGSFGSATDICTGSN